MKTELKEKMMDMALEHIYKVNEDPDIELEDVDAYDAWIRFDKDWDLNVHEAILDLRTQAHWRKGLIPLSLCGMPVPIR